MFVLVDPKIGVVGRSMGMLFPVRPHDRDLVRSRIRVVPDFPKPGILFQDITPILGDSEALQAAVRLHGEAIADLWSVSHGTDADGAMISTSITSICGIESRGFLFGMALAQALGVGFFPARKPGKLPCETIEESYEKEYGLDHLHIHKDSVKPGDRVLFVDDLMAFGSSMKAAMNLVRRLGGEVVGGLVLIELVGLGGREKLEGSRIDSIFKIET